MYDPDATSVETLREWIVDCGYHCAGQSAPGHVCDPIVAPDHGPHDHAAAARADAADGHGHGGHAGMSMAAMVADMRNRFLVSLIFTIPIVLWSGVGSGLIGSDLATPFGIGRNWWLLLLSLPVVLYSSSIFFTGAWNALRARTLDMMVLVAVAVGIAFAYSAAVTFGLSGETFYDAAAMLATFVLLGHWFEMRARGGANDAIRTLLDLAPPKATVMRDGEPIEMPTAEVTVGDVLLIRPGAKVPVDAEVVGGSSQVDESAVTGESVPVGKRPGDKLIGATINKQGTLRARATAIGSDTALAQIVALVQTAQNSKAPGQRLADRAAFWLVLVALTAGVLTFLIWWAIVGRDVEQSLLFAIAVIVITCPDALGLATPTAIMVGSSLGAKRGILFKHALALERGAQIDTVVFDKTGTLTRGEPQVVAITVAPGQSEDQLLAAVASVERESEHPLATAIVKAASERGLALATPQAFEAIPGHGVLATIDGRRLAIGNHRLIEDIGAAVDGLGGRGSELAGQGRTVVEVALDDHLAGVIAVADAPRDTAAVAPTRRPLGHAVRRQRSDRTPHRRPSRDRRGHRRSAPGRQGGQDHRAPSPRAHGGHGRRRRQRRAGPGASRRRHRHRRRHRRGRRDGRHRADALRPARRRDRNHDQPRHAAQDAPEPGLGGRLQLAGHPGRRWRLRTAGLHPAPRGRGDLDVGLQRDRRR